MMITENAGDLILDLHTGAHPLPITFRTRHGEHALHITHRDLPALRFLLDRAEMEAVKAMPHHAHEVTGKAEDVVHVQEIRIDGPGLLSAEDLERRLRQILEALNGRPAGGDGGR